MTSEERRRIAGCRIAVVGACEFIDSIKAELQQLGFESIQIISSSNKQPAISNFDVIAENVNEGSSCMSKETDIPLILPFDFVNGAGVIVVMPDDERDIICKPELRQWAATIVHFGMSKDASGCEIRCQTLKMACRAVRHLKPQHIYVHG